jgi:hypothetical protein
MAALDHAVAWVGFLRGEYLGRGAGGAPGAPGHAPAPGARDRNHDDGALPLFWGRLPDRPAHAPGVGRLAPDAPALSPRRAPAPCPRAMPRPPREHRQPHQPQTCSRSCKLTGRILASGRVLGSIVHKSLPGAKILPDLSRRGGAGRCFTGLPGTTMPGTHAAQVGDGTPRSCNSPPGHHHAPSSWLRPGWYRAGPGARGAGAADETHGTHRPARRTRDRDRDRPPGSAR